jgi:hypothetical protein
LASVEAGMFVPRAQAMKAGVHNFAANLNEAIGAHYRENDLALGHESRLATAFNVELGNAAV